jgi:glycosyltransferase involved in cell wall biosynthesis
MRKEVKRCAVIVGCARNCEAYLLNVFTNIDKLTKLYYKVAFVVVENDSSDDTPKILQAWLRNRPDSHLISLNGLAVHEKRRTARLAIARNTYMEMLNAAYLTHFDHLVVLDFDNVNASPISEESFGEAIRYLDSCDENAGVFANQLPYYDIWALRHDYWCPGDCWSEVENRPAYLPRHRAVERYFRQRQIEIKPNTRPVPVQSAFGGLAVYKMKFVRFARYVGLLRDGSEVCEHVAFNRDVVGAGGMLYIFPKLLNHAPPEHVGQQRLMGVRRYLADVDPRSYKFYVTVGPFVRACKGVFRY